MGLGFQIVQTLYWLALSTWFGGALFVAMAAPIVFRTVREADPLLPTVLSVNLDGQHGTLLAGSIVANLLESLLRIELLCAGALLIAISAQWFLIDLGSGWMAAVIRSMLYLAAVGIVLYNWRVLGPRVARHRDEFIEHADDPEIANPAKDRFDRAHRDSVTLLAVELALLLGMVLLSAGIRGATRWISF